MDRGEAVWTVQSVANVQSGRTQGRALWTGWVATTVESVPLKEQLTKRWKMNGPEGKGR